MKEIPKFRCSPNLDRNKDYVLQKHVTQKARQQILTFSVRIKWFLKCSNVKTFPKIVSFLYTMYGQKSTTLNISSNHLTFFSILKSSHNCVGSFTKKIPPFDNVLLRKTGNCLTLHIVLYLFKQWQQNLHEQTSIKLNILRLLKVNHST